MTAPDTTDAGHTKHLPQPRQQLRLADRGPGKRHRRVTRVICSRQIWRGV